jgi:hypothetical protein
LSKVTIEDAHAIQALLVSSILTETLQRNVMNAIDQKALASEPSTGVKDNDPKQEFQCVVEKLQSKECWSVYQNTKSIDTRLMKMARQLRLCGIQKGNEKSYAMATAVALCADGTQDNPTKALENTRRFKLFFHAINPTLFSLRGPDLYPTRVEDLKDTHPALWEQIEKEGGLALIDFDEAALQMIKMQQPCRNTKQGCSQPRPGKHQNMAPIHLSHQDLVALSQQGQGGNGILDRSTSSLQVWPRKRDLQCQFFMSGNTPALCDDSSASPSASPPSGRTSPFLGQPKTSPFPALTDGRSLFADADASQQSPFAPTPMSKYRRMFSSDSLGSMLDGQPDATRDDGSLTGLVQRC